MTGFLLAPLLNQAQKGTEPHKRHSHTLICEVLREGLFLVGEFQPCQWLIDLGLIHGSGSKPSKDEARKGVKHSSECYT